VARPGYPAEFSLDLVEAGRSIADVAHDLEISEQTIYTWRPQDRVDRGLVAGLSSSERAELTASRKRIAELEAELAVSRRAVELLKERSPQRRFAAAEVMAAERMPVQLVCRVLGISESGYYERRTRAPSERSIRHAWLTDLIRQIHFDSRGTYGSRRVHAELRLGHGVAVGHGAVEMLMHRAGVAGAAGRPKRKRPSLIPSPLTTSIGSSHALRRTSCGSPT
jgi:putative transposase